MAQFPSTTAADGIWSLKQQRRAKLGDDWPLLGPIDPDFANVSLLLHGDGTDGSTTFTDSSSNNLTVTANGDAQIDTAVKKFGTGSMQFDGSDWLSIANNAELNLGGGDFTIEGWIYFNASGNWSVVAQGTTSSRTGLVLKGDANRWVLQEPNSNVFVISWTPTLSQWYYFACVRNGTTATMYIDGSSIGSGTLNNYTDGSDPTYIARNITNTEYLNGYIDDLRITKGVARYTANFTPPTEAFPDQ